MLAIAWGFLIYSLFIVSMNVLTTLSEEEKGVYAKLVKEESISGMRDKADKVIGAFLVFNLRSKKRDRRVERYQKNKAFITEE